VLPASRSFPGCGISTEKGSNPEHREVFAKRYCSGWFIGVKGEKKAMIEDLREKDPVIVWEGGALRELNQVRWDDLILDAMAAAGKLEEDVQKDRKGAHWKAAFARELRKHSMAGNAWIAKRLNMGHPSEVTNLVVHSTTVLWALATS